jgi:hypothetical protein
MASPTLINFLRARDAATVTPNDSTDLPRKADSLYVGIGGTVNLTTFEGTTLLFSGVQSGSVLPVGALRVLATSTTASDIVALFE